MIGAWEFFSNPVNLSKITPPWLNFKVVSDIPQNMHSGMIITYRIRLLACITKTFFITISLITLSSSGSSCPFNVNNLNRKFKIVIFSAVFHLCALA